MSITPVIVTYMYTVEMTDLEIILQYGTLNRESLLDIEQDFINTIR